MARVLGKRDRNLYRKKQGRSELELFTKLLDGSLVAKQERRQLCDVAGAMNRLPVKRPPKKVPEVPLEPIVPTVYKPGQALVLMSRSKYAIDEALSKYTFTQKPPRAKGTISYHFPSYKTLPHQSFTSNKDRILCVLNDQQQLPHKEFDSPVSSDSEEDEESDDAGFSPLSGSRRKTKSTKRNTFLEIADFVEAAHEELLCLVSPKKREA
eukprot:TRINITY_DN30863_c0_g1_i1.p1 TRINITY_DN30863_c0_g1~~TRINITY_DN30863_c0_g1_i1.p1  ORF type:complete len:224 (+),score=26.89 TRINITY_DN30863_c0_g1_i1:45-674(+)